MQRPPLKELLNFKNKTMVVTGGSFGIGFGIVRRFAEAGANIVIADVQAAGEEKAKQVAKDYNVKTLFIRTDVSSENDVANLLAETEKKFGSIDVFVNNAGIYPTKPVLEMSLADWEKTQAVNLRSVFLCSREAAKMMIKHKTNGNIVNIASVDALHPSMVGLASYDASKHGVWGFTKNFALELAPHNIRINAIAPGGIRTEGIEIMSGGKTKASGDEYAPMDVPMKRMGEPDEIAMVVLFLAGTGASYMTGSLVVVDGGMLLK